MANAQLIVERLEHCRKTGEGRWIAKCPAHKDSSPSLVITQKDGDRVLIHCHAGCSTGDILDSLSLDWGALMPDSDQSYRATRITRQDAGIVDEMTILIADSMFKRGERLSEVDKARVLSAKLRALQTKQG